MPVEPCGESDLAGESPSWIGARRHHGAVSRIPPFHHSSVVAKPVQVLGRIVTFEVDHGRNETDPIRGLRIAAEKIVLSQLADHSITTEQQRQGFDDRRFPTVVGSDEDGVWRELNRAFADAAKVFDF
jgi:hypothetical protein